MISSRAAFLIGLLAATFPVMALAAEPPLLSPRAIPKRQASASLVVPHDATGRLIIKFSDELRGRAAADGSLRKLAPTPTPDLDGVLARFRMVLRPAFEQSEEFLAQLEARARAHSNRLQPDLAGIVYAHTSRGNLLAAARALNDLPEIEWVEIEQVRRLASGAIPAAALVPGACCLPDYTCVDGIEPTDCVAIGGVAQGNNTVCANPVCGSCCLNPGTGLCRDFRDEDVCINTLGGTYQGDFVSCSTPGTDCFVGGACCLGDAFFTCTELTEDDCVAQGGTFQGVGVPCPASGRCGSCCLDEETCVGRFTIDVCGAGGGIFVFATDCAGIDCSEVNGCGESATGDCFDPPGNGTPFCDDANCCNLVCQIGPLCCDENWPFGWDPFCAAVANLFCDGGDRCASPINDSCFEPHDTGGCNDPGCCLLVCGLSPGCCMGTWDATCVALAQFFCATPEPPDAPTPNLEPYQGYLTPAPYDPVPDAYLNTPVGQGFFGFNGVGFNLRSEGEPFEDLNGNGWWDVGEPFDDLNGNGIWDKPAGLYGFAEELYRVWGLDSFGQGNLARGKTIRVGVIEWGAFPEHEAYDVIVEPGQTVITIDEVSEPDHGTACLSIIGSREDGIGLTGIAPESELWFFPLTSAEQGYREPAAWASALAAFRAGDVLSCSYGPGPPVGNLNNSQVAWTLIRLASDLGITVCIAAGNDCYNLDDAPDLGDSGGVVVGACSPGSNQYRLGFSNRFREADPQMERSNIVHARAWGSFVASAGYGNLFAVDGPAGSGVNRNRTYTINFGGTSAASPIVAGILANLQGLAKQIYGIPLSPANLRIVCGMPGGVVSTPIFQPAGYDDQNPCGLDLDPDQDPTRLGVLINVAGSFGSAASAMLNQGSAGFADSPLIQDIAILRGNRLFGNRFSVMGSDNNYLVLESVHVDRSESPYRPPTGGPAGGIGGGNANVPEARNATYLATGQITDVVAVGLSLVENPTGFFAGVELGTRDVPVIVFVEAYDWLLRRWQYVAIEYVAAGGADEAGNDVNVGGALPSAQRFVRQSDGRILVRVWTYGFVGADDTSGPSRYRNRIDLIQIQIGQEFGEG